MGPPTLLDIVRAGRAVLVAPFDAARRRHARAVRAGFVERSLLASGRFERAIDRIERIMLGPFARRV